VQYFGRAAIRCGSKIEVTAPQQQRPLLLGQQTYVVGRAFVRRRVISLYPVHAFASACSPGGLHSAGPTHKRPAAAFRRAVAAPPGRSRDRDRPN
jgi:hypothetical protein